MLDLDLCMTQANKDDAERTVAAVATEAQQQLDKTQPISAQRGIHEVKAPLRLMCPRKWRQP